MHSYIKKYKFKAKFSQFLIESRTQKVVNNDYFDRVTTFIVLDISTIYLTEPTIKVLISFFTLPATASRSIFYLY